MQMYYYYYYKKQNLLLFGIFVSIVYIDYDQN